MKDLRKILAVALVMIMCIGLMPVRSLAIDNSINQPTPNDPPNDPPNGTNPPGTWTDPTYDPTNQTGTNNPPNDPTNGDDDSWQDYDYCGDRFDDYDDQDKEKEEVKEEDKKDEKAESEAEEVILKIILTVGSKDLEKYLNEVKSTINMDIAPYINTGRTMIPIRYLGEALGMKVTWDEKTRTVILEDDKFKIEIPVDTNKIIVNGEEFESDVMPEIRNGRTMLAIANIARALGLKDGEDIFWDPVEKKATIIRKITK